MSSDPEVPTATKLANGKTDSVWVFNYYKAHYWDAIDFSDDRILRTPFLEAKIDRYIKNLVVQTPDSLIKDTDWLISKASANKDVKSYVVFYIINQYALEVASEVMDHSRKPRKIAPIPIDFTILDDEPREEY